MNAYYIQAAEKITPIFGVSSIEEAKAFVDHTEHRYIVETSEDVYMNLATGSVGFESEWDDLSEVVKVDFSADEERWIEC